jgi:hypothetical protein
MIFQQQQKRKNLKSTHFHTREQQTRKCRPLNDRKQSKTQPLMSSAITAKHTASEKMVYRFISDMLLFSHFHPREHTLAGRSESLQNHKVPLLHSLALPLISSRRRYVGI